MSDNLLADIICMTAEKELFPRRAHRGIAQPDKAMLVSFRTFRHDNDTIYHHADLLIWAPTNYVQVWKREWWTPRIEGVPKGETLWTKLSDHDSGWREDGVRRFIRSYELATFGGPLMWEWYSIIDVPEWLKEGRGK